MANETKTPAEGAEEEPKTQEGEGTETGTEEEPAAEGQGGDEGGVEDKHGQPGINREKYNRDMAAKDKEIAELKEQIAEAAKTEEGRKALEEKIAKLESDQKDERTAYDLKLAGIRDEKAAKAAKAMLADYDGDVAKLKEDCPYLFSDGTKQTGSTGLKPDGSAEKALDDKLDRAFGLKKE